MLFPEAVLVEPLPDGVLLDVQHEVGLDVFELQHFRLADAGHGVPPCAHPPAVDLVPVVDHGDVADHRPTLLREDVQLLTQRSERDLHVLEDAVRFGLVVEGLLARLALAPGALDRVQTLVVHPAKAERLLRLDELIDALPVQQRLHELPGLPQIEQLTRVRRAAHLQDAPALVPLRVRARPRRDFDLGLPPGEG